MTQRTNAAPSEPDQREWIDRRINDTALQKLCDSKDLLKDAGVWLATLGHWTRLQIVTEATWDQEEENDAIGTLESLWLEKNKLEDANLTREELKSKLKISAACTHWSQEKWGHRIDSLYLQKKTQLDLASCRLLRVSDKDLANELYHRVKAKEASFEELARQFGEGPERIQGGLIPLQPMHRLPFGLAPVLQRLTPKQVSTPLRLNKTFCIIELLKFSPSSLDERTSDMLLNEELKLWISSVVEILDADL